MDSQNLQDHKFIQLVEDHYNPLGVCRSLGEKGIKPIVILVTHGNAPCMLNHSKYVSKFYTVESLEEGYDLLLNNYGNEAVKPFVFCSDDKTESFLDNRYDELKDKFIFYNATEQGRITRQQNKDVITNLAVEAGLSIPNKEIVDTGTLPKKLKYPIITKVLASTMGAWKDDVHICNSEAELIEAYKKIKSPKLCLQEYIHKKGEFCMEGFSINDGKDVFIPLVCNYQRYYDNSYGHYMTFSPFTDDNLKQKICALFQKTKYNGIFEIEFMRGPNDEIYFLEINFRASTWNYAMTTGGGNLPYYWAKSTLLGRIPYEEMQIATEPFNAMVEPEDLINNVFKSRTVKLSQWIKEVKNCKCHYYYNSKDSAPFWGYVRWRILRNITKRLKRSK